MDPIEALEQCIDEPSLDELIERFANGEERAKQALIARRDLRAIAKIAARTDIEDPSDVLAALRSAQAARPTCRCRAYDSRQERSDYVPTDVVFITCGSPGPAEWYYRCADCGSVFLFGVDSSYWQYTILDWRLLRLDSAPEPEPEPRLPTPIPPAPPEAPALYPAPPPVRGLRRDCVVSGLVSSGALLGLLINAGPHASFFTLFAGIFISVRISRDRLEQRWLATTAVATTAIALVPFEAAYRYLFPEDGPLRGIWYSLALIAAAFIVRHQRDIDRAGRVAPYEPSWRRHVDPPEMPARFACADCGELVEQLEERRCLPCFDRANRVDEVDGYRS